MSDCALAQLCHERYEHDALDAQAVDQVTFVRAAKSGLVD
jgi:hypothetical protein